MTLDFQEKLAQPVSLMDQLSALLRWKLKLSLLVLILLQGSVFLSWSQYGALPPSWRFVPLIDVSEPYSVAVSLSPNGDVWSHLSGLGLIQRMDGYDAQIQPDPDAGNIRVYEGAESTLWTFYSKGIRRFSAGSWDYLVIPQIEDAQNLPQLRLRPASLVPHPTHPSKVYYLSSRGLEELDFLQKVSRVILSSESYSELGEMIYLTPGNDSGLWITCSKGVLWSEVFPLPDGDRLPWEAMPLSSEFSDLRILDYPAIEDPQGRLVMTSEFQSTGLRIASRVTRMESGAEWIGVEYPNSKIRFVWPGAGGSIWAQTTYDLLTWSDGHYSGITKDRLRPGQYYDVAVSDQGDFWLGAASGILARLNPLWSQPLHDTNAKQVSYGMAYDENRNNILSLVSEGILIFQEESGTSILLPAPEGLAVNFHAGSRMQLLPDGDLALNSSGRIFLVDVDARTWSEIDHPEGLEMDLLGVSELGELYIQTLKVRSNQQNAAFGIELWDRSTGTWSRLMESPRKEIAETVQFFWKKDDSTYWMGSESGLAEYQVGSKSWKARLSGVDQIPGGAIHYLEMSDGRIWVAGQRFISEYQQGAWKIVQGGFERPTSILEGSDGFIWVTSANGVHCYNPSLDAWTIYQEEDGLAAGVHFSVIETASNSIWVAGEQGVSRFNPLADQESPQVAIKGPGELTQYGLDANYSVYFDGQDSWNRTDPERLFYSYRLDSGPWTDFSSANYANFLGIGAGTHSIEARALDRNFNVSRISMPFDFEVILPWYVDKRLIGISVVGILIIFVLGIIAVNRHLSLVKSYAAVEKIVEKRTSELQEANRALLHSQKMQALGSLAAGIAHDFNNILSIIKGSAQIISRNMNDDEKIHVRLGRIQSMVDQGAEIVRAMLGFSQASGGKIEEFTIDEILSDTRHLLGDRFLHQVRIEIAIEPGLPDVVGSKEFLQQILLNLTFNAVDSMGGAGKIHIHGKRTTCSISDNFILPPSQQGECIEIQVRDTGSGMTTEILSRIFEPFFTTKALSNRRGAGLGLAMVYQLAEELGYGLNVKSKVGEGSCFYIFIPIKVDSEEGQVA